MASVRKGLLTRRYALAALGGLPFLSASSTGAAGVDDGQAFRKIEKTMWVWKFEPDQLGKLHTFATTHGITTLLVSLPADARSRLIARDGELADSIRVLSGGGLEVWALAGDPAWIEQPNQIARPLRDLFEIQESLQLFRGLHLDVEPHAHPRWRLGAGPQSQLLEGFVDFLAIVAGRVHPLPIEAAVNPMMAQLSLLNGENALLGIARHLSSISIMAYRDSASATINWAAAALDVLKSINVRWRMGVLVHQSVENRISFFQTPPPEFRQEMLKLDRLLRARSDARLYRGLVFEDYDGLRGLFGTQSADDRP